MKHIMLILFICLNEFAYTQEKDQATIYYENGNAAFAVKNYRIADSLFTLSINLTPHPDSYYNRAASRRQLNNLKGYCLDLNSASELGDIESGKLYSKQCMKYDTIYKKDSEETASKMDYDFVEYLKTFKYSTDFDYEKLDKSKNIIVSKIRRNNDVIYKQCTEVIPAKYKQELDSLITKIKFKTDFLKVIKEKNLSGYLSLDATIDEKGRVKDSRITFGEYNEVIPVILKEVFDSLNWIPAKYNERNVKSITNITIVYYDEELSFNSPSFSKTNNIEIKNSIEIMPEYPGGQTEMMKYFQKNIKIPEIAKKAGLTGKCYIKFVVLPNGAISNVTVLKGIAGCSECDKEAIRLVKSMPKWTPGTQNKQPVPVLFNLPLSFQLK